MKNETRRSSGRALLERLYNWGIHLGGWDSPAWGDLETYVKKGGEFEIQETLVVGTAHITEEDSSILCQQANSDGPAVLVAYENEYWIQVFLGGDDFVALTESKTFKDLGLSEDAARFLRIGFELGCTWVKFDRDGPAYNGFTTHEW